MLVTIFELGWTDDNCNHDGTNDLGVGPQAHGARPRAGQRRARSAGRVRDRPDLPGEGIGRGRVEVAQQPMG